MFCLSIKIPRCNSVTGDSASGATRGEYCGRHEDITLISTQNLMTVTFLTDNSKQLYGFTGSFFSGRLPGGKKTDSKSDTPNVK